ncbi:MAG: hypothetical protein RL397_1918 [Pseudomonadota bacterium]|jgi:hypothetical protein
MKLTNFLDHPALNQLRLAMGADKSLSAPPVGWHPRLLDAEEVMRLGQPSPAEAPAGGDIPAPSAERIKAPRAVPVRYSRDRESSKILNPIGLPKGAIAVDVIDSGPLRSPDPQILRRSPHEQIPAPPPPAETRPNAAYGGVVGEAWKPSDPHEGRRRRNQSALAALRKLEGDDPA